MKTFFFVILLGLAALVQAQTLKYEKGRLSQDGNYLAPRQWESAFAGNTEALEYVKKAKSNYGTSQVLAAIGGFMIGWPIGTAIGGGEPEWAMLGAGAGIAAISIPLSSAAKKNMNKAIQLQNGSSSSSRNHMGVTFGGNQVGLKYQF